MKKKVRIVLADDHGVVRQGLRLLLEADAELEVVGESASAAEAVQQVEELRPDVLLLDITMPGGGGIAALEQIQKASPATRVLILTMHEEPEYLRVALTSGAAGFVLKQAAGPELLTAIRKVHGGRTYVDPTLAGTALQRVLEAASRKGPKNGQRARLSAREVEVLRHLALGYANKEVASLLSVSVKSIETYRARVSQKLGLSGRAELVRFALENGIVVPDGAPPPKPSSS